MTTDLAMLGVAVVSILGVGVLASLVDRYPRLGPRLGCTLAILLLLTLAWSIVTGQLFRYAPGAQDDTGDEAAHVP